MVKIMSARLPKLEELRSRVQSKVAQARGRFAGQRGGGYSPQMQIGGGQLINRAKAKAEQIMRKVKERRPGIIPMVKEFKPGERIRKVIPTGVMRGDITSLPIPTRSGREFSIAEEPAKPFNRREIVIER